ncbi:hypothetical protein [Streptomyces sp. NPDC056160]|uniref:hypothetical protein n=1 Tax=Streptomyces sp. NPDC056160 TaxID=3345731 RepID=UPI0035DBE522
MPPRAHGSGEGADLIGRPVAQPLPRAQPPEQIAGRERGGRGARHDHPIPSWDSNSIRCGVSVAARLH